MAKTHPLGYEDFDAAMSYDPETGLLAWKIKPSRRHAIGAEAGRVKNVVSGNGQPKEYKYVTYRGYSTTVARVAWLLTHKEWPKRNILNIDGDTLNTRLVNLKLGDTTSGDSNGPLTNFKMNKEVARNYGLKRYYGMTGEEYGHMLASQGGVCAICANPEVRLDKHGQPVALHVDHDHATNEVRALLCYKCNSALGSMNDDPFLLRKAADYIEKHSGSNVVPFVKEPA